MTWWPVATFFLGVGAGWTIATISFWRGVRAAERVYAQLGGPQLDELRKVVKERGIELP